MHSTFSRPLNFRSSLLLPPCNDLGIRVGKERPTARSNSSPHVPSGNICIVGGLSPNSAQGSTQIPPALWATGGLAIATGKLPLSLPSPRALDPARPDHSRVHIGFARVYELPGESLQKCNAKLSFNVVLFFLLTAVGRVVAFTKTDKTTVSFFQFFQIRLLPGIGPMKHDRS